MMFMWIGLGINPEWVRNVFGVSSAAQIDIDKVRLNSTLVITCYFLFILYLQTFCGMSDCVLIENIIKGIGMLIPVFLANRFSVVENRFKAGFRF